MTYKIDYLIDLDKALKRIPKQDAKKIKEKVQKLADNPRPHGAIKMSGRELYRIRAGNYRVVYSIYDSRLLILIVEVDGRDDIYKRL
jgi:mRNA interferase RelE/StbE